MRKKSPSRPARRGNLARAAADHLRRAILRSEYSIGMPLREEELARELGLSRVPVREALRILEGEGLVHIRPNRGAVVAEISEDEILEIAEVCVFLEAHLLRLAVPCIDEPTLARAEALLEAIDETEDPFEWTRLNWSFHTTLYAPAGRPLQLELLSSLRQRAERAMLLLVAPSRQRALLGREHRGILAAVRARRAREASRRLEAHLRGGGQRVLRQLEAPR